MKKKVLLVCTGNSCRSQMAEGILKKLAPGFDIMSAGTEPELKLSAYTSEVMKEIGISMEGHYPKDVFDYAGKSFDYVITLSKNAKKALPKFTGKIHRKIHIEFLDPAAAKGPRDKILEEYREVRDEILKAFTHLYETKLKPKQSTSGK